MDAVLTKKADELAKEFAGQATTLEELNSAMRALMKTALESMLNSELDVHLGRASLAGQASLAESTLTDAAETASLTDSTTDVAVGSSKPRNRRNGTSPKTIQGDMGKLPLAVPRDRDGTFAPLLLGKYQRRLPGFDEKILALYAKGMTTRDIQEIVKELYGVEISPTLVSEITEDLDGEVRAWQTRRLDSIWPIVFLDGIVVHIRGGHRPKVGRGTSQRTHDVRGDWREFRGKKGTSRSVAERNGGCEVLAVVPDRSEESRRDRHLHHLCRWPHGIPRGDPSGVPPGSRAVVHRASGPGRLEVRHRCRQSRSDS